MANVMDVAKYIRARVPGAQWDNFILQKLLYFSEAWTLAWTGHDLFTDNFEAWPDGPVVRSVWVTQRYSVFSGEPKISEEDAKLIDDVLAEYGSKTRDELIALSHENVWNGARAGLAPNAPSRNVLNRGELKDVYTSLAIAGQGPRRSEEGTAAIPDEVEDVALRVMERWREGLDILADR